MKRSAVAYKKRSKWLAPVGLSLIGAGFCVAAEGAIQKFADAPTWEWVIWGTVGLVVMNTGVVLFGEAVKCATLAEQKENQGA